MLYTVVLTQDVVVKLNPVLFSPVLGPLTIPMTKNTVVCGVIIT